MIGYVTFGTNDLERARGFYDALLAVVGIGRIMEFPSGTVWGAAMDKPSLGILKPYNGEAATVGNGAMAALVFDSPEKVNAIYAKAIELGGKDEGPAGPRGDGGFYAGYFRDLDGNKLNAYCMVPKA